MKHILVITLICALVTGNAYTMRQTAYPKGSDELDFTELPGGNVDTPLTLGRKFGFLRSLPPEKIHLTKYRPEDKARVLAMKQQIIESLGSVCDALDWHREDVDGPHLEIDLSQIIRYPLERDTEPLAPLTLIQKLCDPKVISVGAICMLATWLATKKLSAV